MIEFSIHLPSVAVGFFIGYGLMCALWIWDAVHDRGEFAKGWDCGCEYARRTELEKIAKEKQTKEGAQE